MGIYWKLTFDESRKNDAESLWVCLKVQVPSNNLADTLHGTNKICYKSIPKGACLQEEEMQCQEARVEAWPAIISVQAFNQQDSNQCMWGKPTNQARPWGHRHHFIKPCRWPRSAAQEIQWVSHPCGHRNEQDNGDEAQQKWECVTFAPGVFVNIV